MSVKCRKLVVGYRHRRAGITRDVSFIDAEVVFIQLFAGV